MALDFNTFSEGFQTEGPPAGGGLSSLLTNRLFLSYLSKSGAALNPQAGGIDALTQQLIGAANAKDLQDRNRRELRALLSGKGVTESISDPGSPLQKVTQTKDKTLLELADLGVEGGSSEGGQSIAGGGAERAVLKQLKEENSNFGGILSNPSSGQSGASYQELAGLSAEDISRISRDAIATETGIAGIKYRQALGEQARAQASAIPIQAGTRRLAEMRKWQESIRRAPFEVDMSFTEWKSLDSKTKAYHYYAYNAKQNDEAVLDFNEWDRQADPTTIEQIYNVAKDDKGFRDFYFKQKALGGGLDLKERGKIQEQTADIKSKKFFTDPKGLSSTVRKRLSSDEFQNKIFSLSESDRDKTTVQEAENESVRLIKNSGGTIVDSRVEGRTFIWTVKWPDGSTSEVKYANQSNQPDVCR